MAYLKVKDLMRSMGIRQSKLAEMLGLTQGCFSLKLNGERPLMMDEAREIQKYLGISDNDFVSYFYEP